MHLLSWIYAIALLGMALFGYNILLNLLLAIWYRSNPERPAPSPDVWPPVLIQLPIFNERYVAERVIDAAATLNYPPDRFTIQVLDDSTDDTSAIAKARVAYHRSLGRQVLYRHRAKREGFKARALAEGLRDPSARGEFVAIFDADFVPPPDFLRRAIPEFQADPRLGMVQARWEHLNAEQSALTLAQALSCDGYFMVDQIARSRAGMLMNFNGSAGIWRRACIEDAGGWSDDTLAEDLDLSYRAQLKGWRMGYLPDVAAPAELPASIIAFKRQQFRWAKGSYQVLRKLGPQLLTAEMSIFCKVQGFMHLAGYLGHPLMLISLILSLPVVLLHGQIPFQWSALGLAGLGPPLAGLWGQLTLRQDWTKRIIYYPALVLVGIGLALTTTHAMWEAFFGRTHEFVRTPKFSSANQRENKYALPLDWTTWGELILSLYALATGLLAVDLAPGLAPFIFLYAAGFGYIAILGFWQSGGMHQTEEAKETVVE